MNALLSLILVAVPASGVEVVEEGSRAAFVMNLEAEAEDASVARLVRDQVAAELGKRRMNVLTSGDVKRVAGIEAERQAAGCEDDSSCLVELAGAIGAELIVYGSVGKLGALRVVNLTLFNASTAQSVARINVETEDEGELPARIRAELDRALGEDAPAVEAERPWTSSVWFSTAGWVLLGAGTLGAVVFGADANARDQELLLLEGRNKQDTFNQGWVSLGLATGCALVAAGGLTMVIVGWE